MTDTIRLYQTPPDICFIKGDEFSIPFLVYDDSNCKIDLSILGTSIEWLLCEHENSSTVLLQKTGIVDPVISNRFDVNLGSVDTKTLDAPYYTYQVKITDPKGNTRIRLQGNLCLLPQIGG